MNEREARIRRNEFAYCLAIADQPEKIKLLRTNAAELRARGDSDGAMAALHAAAELTEGTAEKIALYREELAELTMGSTEYYDALTTIVGLEQQLERERG